MILRKAELKDFKVYKKLFEDENGLFQWLYINRTKQQLEDIYCEEDFSDIIEYYKKYSIERFEKDLETLYIFMIEKNDQVIGYISMFYCGKGNYKIAEWAMLNPDDNETKKAVIEKLVNFKLPRLRSFTICTPYDKIAKFLLSNGFVDSSGSFYKLEVKGKK